MKMKRLIIIGLILSAGIVMAGGTNAPAVTIPKGLVAASQKQKDFVKALAALSVGSSRAAVQQALGAPAQTNAATWFYDLKEDPDEGGYYVTASLTFGTNGLSGGSVGFGHVTMVRKDEE